MILTNRKSWVSIVAVVALLAATLAMIVGSASPAAAATFTPAGPNQFADPPPDGCAPADCSLREAIIAANANPGADTISVPAGTYELTIQNVGDPNPEDPPTKSEDAAMTGDLDITDSVAITGAGAATTVIDGSKLRGKSGNIDGRFFDRVFHSKAGASGVVGISGVTIKGGRAPDSYTQGGVGESGGGVWNESGALTITNAVITMNQAGNGGPGSSPSGNAGAGGQGGGIYNEDRLTITGSTVSNNTSGSGGKGANGSSDEEDKNKPELTKGGNGGNGGNGGGISSKTGATTTISGNVIKDNTVGTGGTKGTPTFGGAEGTSGIAGQGPNVFPVSLTAVTHDVGLVAGGIWTLRDHKDGSVTTITFGTPTDVPIMGDWNCNGIETPGLFRAQKDPADPNLPEGLAYYRNDNAPGVQVGIARFVLGNPGDIPLAGDFNGDGCDSLSVYRPSEQKFYIADKLPPPIPLNQPLQPFNADHTFTFGNAGDKPFVGDFDGDGKETVGLHRESTGRVYYTNASPTGLSPANVAPTAADYIFGDPGDQLVAGDWVIVDGKFSPALFRPSVAKFFFRDDNAISSKPAAAELSFGTVGSAATPVSGVMGL